MPDIGWYVDRAAVTMPITIGSMLVLCVVHAVQSNIAKTKVCLQLAHFLKSCSGNMARHMVWLAQTGGTDLATCAQDIFLQTMCLAIAANMSGSFKNLHAYVAQRLLRYVHIYIVPVHLLRVPHGVCF